MSRLTSGIHTHTPTLAVVDPRGLAVRVVTYCRSVETAGPEERINRSAYDAMGRLTEQWDSRLWALRAEDHEAPANLVNRYSLFGKVLSSISVDAGKRVSLFGDGDQLVQTWDSRGSERRIEYDNLLRPLAISEQGEGETPRFTERYEYADGSAEFAPHNQCGQLIRHDDPAGTLMLDDYALTGGVLEQTQRFLSALESPDWPPGLPERDALLEPVEQAATTATYFNPLGDVLEQTDAKGNRQLFDYTMDGQLLASHLQLSGQDTPQTLVSAIAYNAYGQVEQETAGNGVVSTLTYRPEDGRLTRLQARRGSEVLQDLRYDYDPVGNVLSIEDGALPIRYFANQRVEPVKHYDYDSLYQLIEATGWEAGAASRGPGFNRFDDPGAVANYHQTYRYDAGGNLLELVHVGPQSHSRKLTAARYSNRCLPEQNDRPPTEEEIAAAFDGNGNLLELQPGQAMSWDLRNQLREVRPVARESADDDRELYLYGGDGMRRRKVRSTQTKGRSLISEVRYLPGLEIRTREGTGEVLQVICVQAGRSAMQVLHWETAPPSGIANDQYRYNLTDHLGSSSLELDSEAEVISQEAYHPYGSTAWFAGRSEVEASYKTVRYSGKERDATGLYYYGFRYYAAWLQRWINPDPAGSLDGSNRYRMVRNNPMAYKDESGLFGFADLFGTGGDDFNRPHDLAVELDRYVVRKADVAYSESYYDHGDREGVLFRWSAQEESFFPSASEQSSMEEHGDYARGFLKDLIRVDYTLSGGSGTGSEYKIFLHSSDYQIPAGVSEFEFLEGTLERLSEKIVDPYDRARLSEVASQVNLVPTARVALEHSEMNRYFLAAGGLVGHDIVLHSDETITVRSRTGYKVADSETDEIVEGIHLSAVGESRIGVLDGRLSHEALRNEPRNYSYELRYEVPKTVTDTPRSRSRMNPRNWFRG
ncbi:RHS repeat domain-containing protein [Pseudomonas gingeri]|uniref:RHS repeat domain-containing protein n=1 Tax=Pseudomonas gingeri TaxID=117681 RepID=UPI00210E6DBE|nr:RHS repeat-associated core domain-containing protein [Pseudomonas gingeri]